MANGLLVRLLSKVAPSRVSYRRARLNTRAVPVQDFVPLIEDKDIAKYFNRFIFAISDAEKKAKGAKPQNAFWGRIQDWFVQAQGNKFFKYIMRDNSTQVYALKGKNGEIYGGFSCRVNEDDDLLVSSMFLSEPASRKRSVVTQMLEIIKKQAQLNNCDAITCTTTRNKLFRKFGFQEERKAFGAYDMSCPTEDFAKNWLVLKA